jgi:putative hydrolase of the HAD superfamily
MIQVLLFDLDDTLYPPGSGIMDELRDLIHLYIRTHLDLKAEEASALQRHYFQSYGTTMRGLQVEHRIDPEEFLEFVHNIPLHKYIRPNPELDSVLTIVPLKKVVFTNASREHAERVLARLGIRHHFARIIDVRDVGYESKPQKGAYRRICEILQVRPEDCALIEDNIRNLLPAKELGMTTILIRDGQSEAEDGVDHVIPCIEEIGRLFGP